MFLAALLLSLATPCVSPRLPAHSVQPGTAATEYLLRDLPGVPDDLRQAILAGETQRALGLVRQLADHDTSRRPFWLLIEAAVLQQSGAHAEALALLARAEEIAGAEQSPWLHKLRFARAASHRALGNWKEVESILEAEVDRLRSAGRQSDLAAVILEFADASSTPQQDAPPGSPATDYGKALALYVQALAMDVPHETREYAMWRAGHCRAMMNDWGKAATAWVEWLTAYDPAFGGFAAAPGAAAPVPERVFEVRYQHARAVGNSGDPRGAERAFLDLETALGAFLAGTGALAQRLARPDEARRAWCTAVRGEALYLAGHAAGLSGRRAQQIGTFRRFLETFPRHPRTAEAAFGIGDAEAASGRISEAMRAWEDFLARPPVTRDATAGIGPTIAEAVETDAALRMRAQFRIAGSLFALARYEEAGRAYERYAALFPTGADWAAAQAGMVQAAYEIGADLMRGRRWADARAAWSRFLDQHPLHASARTTFFAIGELFVFEAEGRDTAASAPLLEQAIAHWNDLASRWPGSDEASHALYASGELLEDRLGRLDAAITAYGRCNFGSWSGHARARLARMLEEDLTIGTPRVWRSGEAVRLQADVRNLEELQIEIYPLDVEAYFRKHLTHGGVGQLDLDLIAPDVKFTWKVPDYRRYAPLAREIELPVTGQGAWAVAVSAKNLRATTLVLRSDLDLLVKSSRDELLVLAEDMQRLAAAEGVHVVVAAPGAAPDGGPRVFELTTGSDGVARLDWRALQMTAPDDLRVYASSALGSASTHLHLAGLGFSLGLGARGHVATDRPAYRPGESVRWRAIVRGVASDKWAFTAGEKWRATILDPTGRALWSAQVPLSDFGTLHGELALEDRAPVGIYVLRVSAPDGTVHGHAFEVRQFELPKARVELELEREVVFRGETVAGRATARTWFGEPLADAPLQVFLPGGRRLDLRTNAEGAARFEFDTREAEEGAWLNFLARLPEHGVDAEADAYLAATGFRAEVATRRSVVLAGESFPIEIRARDWSGAGIVADLHLTVVRRERVPGINGRSISVPDTWTERVVLEKDAITDAKTGDAMLTIALDEGGEYRLRLLGMDRFSNPVSAETAITVAGDDDAQKLRFLTDLTTVSVGAETELMLHNGAGPGLALIAFLGSGVIEYRVVNLAEGANLIRFTAGADFWPNFAVSADLLRERAWHTTQVSLRAARALRVEMKPAKERWLPGEEVEIAVTVRDQLGKPVAAEIAAGVVDHALLALVPDLAPDLESAFLNGIWRQAEMRSAATTLFNYAGETRYVAREILDEVLAQEAAQVWDARRREIDAQLGYVSLDGAYPPAAAPATAAAFELEKDMLDGFAGPEDSQLGAVSGGAGGKYGGRGGRAGKHRGGADRNAAEAGQDSIESGIDEALAFWSPRFVTNADGRTTIRFLMPQRSTTWRLLARGVGADTLLGQTEITLESRADFLVELRSSAFLREGDRPIFGAFVHNLTGAAGAAEVVLEIVAGARTWRVPARAEFGPDARSAELSFDLPVDFALPAGGAVQVAVTAEGSFGGSRIASSARRALPVRPWGTEFAAARSGALTADESFTLELPAQHDWRNVALEITLGRGLDELIVQEGLGGRTPFTGAAARSRATPDLASELLGACAALEYVERLFPGGSPDAARLRERAALLAASLISLQQSDGSWTWCAGSGQASGETTARSLWALVEAGARGIIVTPQAVGAAVTQTQEALRRTPSHAYEETAMYLHALARAGAADFGVANRLHRARNEMNSAALAYTVLALTALKSAPMAQEVATLLSGKYVSGRGWADAQARGWHRNPVELTALALLALQSTALRTAAIPSGIEDLLKMRPWPGASARGLAVAALAAWRQETEPADDAFEVEVQVGSERRVVRLARGMPAEPLRFALADGAARAQVRLTLRGRGRPQFDARLTGFTRALVASTDRVFEMHAQTLLAAPPMHAGAEIPTGFGVLNRVEENWVNQASQVALGDWVIGQVEWRRHWKSSEEEADADYLVLEVPLPAGARIAPGTVWGGIEAWEERDGMLVAYIGRTRHGGTLTYRLTGAVPGAWRIAPARLRAAYDPSRLATGTAGSLTVLPRGERSTDPYRPTPDELFHLGSAYYRDGTLEAAAEQLQTLVDGYERLLEESALRSVAEMLLYVGIARNEPQRIVRWFEVLKEKSPELTIPFDQVVVVGRAYRALGEFERATLIFQAVLEETFGKDLRVAGVLENQGDTPGGADAMFRLWLEYPDLPVVVESALTLADRLLQRAPQAHLDPSLARAGLDRAALIGRGVLVLRAFQSLYARDPLAADAGLDLVSAHLDLQNYADALARAAEMARRFPDPHWADTFAYTEAVAAWYLGHDDQAQSLLTRIAEAVYTDPAGSERRSENRDLALYILGQIHHASQEFSEAAGYYEKVATVFADAREALADFREKRLSLNEVASFRPGEPVSVKVLHRNLQEAEVLVYPVDLMTLYLRERNLSGVTGVNLSGIAPTLRASVTLTGGASLRPQETMLPLDLTQPGAYLVIVRGGELHASGLVLVSDIEIEVREDAVQGRLRIQASSRGDGAYLRDADVRVIGSYNEFFVSGRTDPRGIFVADAVAGTSTVIARWQEGHYAFFRGEQVVGVRVDQRPQMELEPSQQLDAGDYLSNVNKLNAERQSERAVNLKSEMDKERKGVQVQQVR